MEEQWSAAEAGESITYAEKVMLKGLFPPDPICGMARRREFLPLHGERFDEEFYSIAGDNGGAFASLPQLLPSTPIDCTHASCEHSRNKRRNAIIRCFFLKPRASEGAFPDDARASKAEVASSLEKTLASRFGDKRE